MSRKRYITSEISINEHLAEIAIDDPVSALMWPWFLKELDDWGRMSAKAMKIKMSIFQAFPAYNPKEIQQAMDAYARVGLVVLYEVDNNPYLQVNPASFYKLQTYIAKERQRKDSSTMPPPPGHQWANYWSESVWGEAAPATDATIAETHTVTAKIAEVSGDQQEVPVSVLSPSLTPSPTLSLSPTETTTMISEPPLQKPPAELEPESAEEVALFELQEWWAQKTGTTGLGRDGLAEARRQVSLALEAGMTAAEVTAVYEANWSYWERERGASPFKPRMFGTQLQMEIDRRRGSTHERASPRSGAPARGMDRIPIATADEVAAAARDEEFRIRRPPEAN